MNLFLRTILYQGQHLGHGYHNRGHDGQLEGDWAIIKDIIWLLLAVGFQSTWAYFTYSSCIKRFYPFESFLTIELEEVYMYMKGVIWVSESMNFQWVEDSFCMDVIFQVELDNH